MLLDSSCRKQICSEAPGSFHEHPPAGAWQGPGRLSSLCCWSRAPQAAAAGLWLLQAGLRAPGVELSLLEAACAQVVAVYCSHQQGFSVRAEDFVVFLIF